MIYLVPVFYKFGILKSELFHPRKREEAVCKCSVVGKSKTPFFFILSHYCPVKEDK